MLAAVYTLKAEMFKWGTTGQGYTFDHYNFNPETSSFDISNFRACVSSIQEPQRPK
jgi:hypothetical protein